MSIIPFNKPTFLGPEASYIQDAIQSSHISGNGPYTKKCHDFFRSYFKIEHCLLTPSGTAALEMCALLADIQFNDEVILPSFTFSSTANAFVLRGARLRFVDSRADHPNMDCSLIEELITEKTKAICAVHYGGTPCDLETLSQICEKYKLCLIEDAAHAINSTFIKKQLGTFGALGAFSFHETKNITCGEGGLLLVNDHKLAGRAEILWEKGTNRTRFNRGEIDKYQWVDFGGSYTLSDLNAAYLWGQLENIETIQRKRNEIWQKYYDGLHELCRRVEVGIPPHRHSCEMASAHLFYLIVGSEEERNLLIAELLKQNIHAVFHYQALHASPYYINKHDGRDLPNAMKFSTRLLRLPLFNSLTGSEVDKIVEIVSRVLMQVHI